MDECKKDEQCRQFTYHGAHCWLSRAIKMGHSKNPDGTHEGQDRNYVSGWDVDKINKWVEENPCEEGPHWVKPSIERKF